MGLGVVLEAEERDLLAHGLRLLIERLGRGCGLFYERRVLLRHLVHLGQCLVDLLDARGLLAAGGCDIGHNRGHLVDRLDDLGERAARPVDELDTVLDLAATAGDQVLDILRGLRRALRKVAHFRSNDREAAARFTGTRRLDRGVERQQVGLAGNLIDHADDVGNLAR